MPRRGAKNWKQCRPAQAFDLNKRQATFITAKSETANATDFTIELVNRFDEYERLGMSGPRDIRGNIIVLLRAEVDAFGPLRMQRVQIGDDRPTSSR